MAADEWPLLVPVDDRNSSDEDEDPIPNEEQEEEPAIEVAIDGTAHTSADRGITQHGTNQLSVSDKKNRPITVQYDLSLPTTHSYLGTDMEELSGRKIHEDDALIDLPLLVLPGVVLVPGQTIPLTVFRTHYVSMIRSVLDSDKTFGLLTLSYSDDNHSQTTSTLGTTAEIYSIKDETDERSGITILKVIAKGRQRFKVISYRRQISGTLMGKVRILTEIELRSPLYSVCLGSLQKYLRQCCKDVDDERVKTAVDRQGRVLTTVRFSPRHSLNKFSSACLTRWPSWVYSMYDTDKLMDLIKRELFSWNESLHSDKIPADPTAFSFWIAQNLPVDDAVRLQLLNIDSSVQRLRVELRALQLSTTFCCQSCRLQVAHKRDIFCFSTDGPMAAYVNPQGYVHDIVTVVKTKGINLVGRASTENSWFPGYAWTIAQCRRCSSHMGWKFTAVNKKLSPHKFFGLCRSSISASITHPSPRESESDPSVDATTITVLEI